MTKDQADFVASELRRLAPAARTPEGGTSHDGRRAFMAAAEHLESVLWSRPELDHQGGMFETTGRLVP